MEPEILEREAVRALLLTPQRELLLLRIQLPDLDDAFWIAPGGGIEPGESVQQCLQRELQEEVGLASFTLGPLLWRRQHTFNWAGRRIRQRERYYAVETARFDPRVSDPVEAKVIERLRWWPIDELAHARERLTPLSLADIVARYLRDGAPAGELELEVLVD